MSRADSGEVAGGMSNSSRRLAPLIPPRKPYARLPKILGIWYFFHPPGVLQHLSPPRCSSTPKQTYCETRPLTCGTVLTVSTPGAPGTGAQTRRPPDLIPGRASLSKAFRREAGVIEIGVRDSDRLRGPEFRVPRSGSPVLGRGGGRS